MILICEVVGCGRGDRRGAVWIEFIQKNNPIILFSSFFLFPFFSFLLTEPPRRKSLDV